MKRDNGLSHRLWRAFLIQAGVISITVIFGVYAARYVIGDILIERALESEAEHFWTFYEADNSFSRPNTYNLTGFLYPEDDDIPQAYIGLPVGIHEFDQSESGFFIVHVSAHNGKILFLEFDGQQVGQLALFFGVFPLAIFLIIIYLSGWVVYRLTSRAVSPVIRLARILEHLDPKSEEFTEKLKQSLPSDTDQEVVVLANALSGLSDRVQSFLMRERNFTRDASHELRSPITVIKISTDFLLEDDQLSDTQRKTIQRIKNNAADMEELIETLLLLARESDSALSVNPVCINDVVKEEVDRCSDLVQNKPVDIAINENQQLVVSGSDKVLSVLIGNLIRNAFSYTDKGKVHVEINEHELVIEDSGVGIDEREVKEIFEPFRQGKNRQRGGYGVGLTIVKMLSDRFHWPITIDSQLHKGTRVTVTFPEIIQESIT